MTSGPKTIRSGHRALDLAGPKRIAGAAVVVVAAALFGASFVEIEQGPMALAHGVQRSEPVLVRHADGGQVARWHLAVGGIVKSGDPLVSLETRALDGIIDALRKQIGAVRARVEAVRDEARALSGVDQNTSGRNRVVGLEGLMADLEKEEVGLKVRLAMHEQDRARTTIRSPVGGRLVEIAVGDGVGFKANAVLATILPDPGRLHLDALWRSGPPAPKAQQVVRVWPEGALLPSAVHTGLIEAIDEAERAEGAALRSRISIDVSGTPLAEPLAGEARMRFVVQAVAARMSLLEHLLQPLQRSQTVRSRPPIL